LDEVYNGDRALGGRPQYALGRQLNKMGASKTPQTQSADSEEQLLNTVGTPAQNIQYFLSGSV
jgi:hypothetical protein